MAVNPGIIPDLLEGNYLGNSDLELPKPDLGILDIINPDVNFNVPSIGGGVSNAPAFDPVESGLNGFLSKPTSGAYMAAPTFFDYNGSQASRYTSSANFNQLGFDPNAGQDNEYKYGARQTWGDVWGNGLTGMIKIAGNSFVEGWKSWVNMADAITSWDSNKLIGTPEELMEQNQISTDIMNKYAIYATPESEQTGLGGIFNRKMFGDMLQQSGFAIGTIAQFLSEELLTMGLATEFSLAKLGLKEAAWAGKIVTKAEVMKDMVRLGDSVWKQGTIAEKMVMGARKLVPFADTIYNMSKYGKAGAGALQIAAIGVGGLKRFLAETNMAMTEARMESAGTYADLYTKIYDEELHKTGEAPDPLLVNKMKEKAMDAAHDNFWVNTGILMISNRIQFDNVFSKFTAGRKALGDGVGQFAEDVLEVSGKKAAKKGAAEATEQVLTKGYQRGRFGTIGLAGQIAKDFGMGKAAWEVSKSVGKGMFKWEIDEGLQELFQDVSNNTLQNYYYDLYHGKKGSDVFEKAITKAVDQETSMQGFKTFLMGAVTGRLISPINFAVGQAKLYGGTSSLERKARKDDIAAQLKIVNAFYENPNKYLNEHIANIKVQNKAAQNMQEAIGNADQYVFTNNKTSGFAKMVSAAIKTDMVDSVINTLRSYGEAFDEKQFKEAFGLEKTNDNIKSVNSFFSKIADKTIDFHETWKTLKNRYGDKVMVDLYKEGTPEHKTALLAKRALDDALEMLATNDFKAKDATIRAVKLQNKMAEIPVIGSSAAIGLRTLGVMQNTELELDILRKEIANTEAIPQKDKATKDLLKVKKEQLKSLEDWVLHSKDLNNMTRGNKRKAVKARKAFENYVNSKNSESKIDTVIKTDDVQDMYETLLDYMDLNKDHKDYIDAYNVLANPIQFVNIHKRLMDAMQDTSKKFLEEHLEEIRTELSGKPPIRKDDEVIKTHTVKLEADGTYSITSPKGNVVAKDIKTEEEANTMAKELDDLLAKDENRPDGLDPNDKVVEFKNGIYLIEAADAEGNLFYYIANKNNEPITETTLDEKKYPTYDPATSYPEKELAKKIYDLLVDQAAGDYKEFSFDGKTLKYGDTLADKNGRKYKVLTKREPRKVKGQPGIVVQQLFGVSKTETIFSLNGLRLESEFEPAGKPENPNAIRLVRNNELVRIYPKKNSFDEELTVAEDRLKKLVNDTPKDQLTAGISIRISKNQNIGEPTIWQEGKEDENKHIHLNPETHMIEIMYNGETIGFATYYNRYTYLSNEGKRTSLDSISKEQFQQIFDIKKKDLNDQFKKFKENHAQSREFFTTLIKQLGKEESVTLTPEETSKLVNFTPTFGEYDFTTTSDPVISLNDIDLNTIEGETYIIDRRTRYLGDGMYEEDPRVQTSAGVIGDKKKSIEDKINAARFEGGGDKLRNYGRYVAAVELPNGLIIFVELQSSVIEKDEITALVEKMNERSKKLKETNLEQKIDAKTKEPYLGARDLGASADINSQINNSIYIAVPGRRGMRVNLSMMPNGNIRVEFATFKKEDNSPVKRDIILKESSTDDTKPLNIKDATDLIERINRAISDHDANSKNSIKKIGISITDKSFKRSLPEDADISQYRQLISGVNQSVVKNSGIFFGPKKNKTSSSSTIIITPAPPAPPTGPKPPADGPDIVVPGDEDIQPSEEELAKMAELLRLRKEQLKNRTIQDQLLDLSNKKDDTIETIQRELLAKGMSRKETMKYNYANDPRIQEINQEIAKLNGGAALKVSETLSTDDITNINDFNKWLKQNLPEFISAEEFRNINRQMKKSGITVGMFYMHMNEINGRLEGKIAVTKNGAFKYHEAFHAIFRMLLTDDQINVLLDQAKKELKASGKTIEQLKKELYESKPEFYGRLTDKQLEERVYEEYLADKFEDWKKDIKVKTAPENKSFFRRLLDFIMNFFKRLKQSPIDDLFMKIEKGGFKNKSAVLNRFTSGTINIGISEPALKSIKIGVTRITNEDGEEEIIPKYLSQQEGDILASTIAAIYHRRMSEAGLRTHNEDIMDDVLVDYAELYDLESNPYYDSDEFEDRYNGSAVAINRARDSIKEKYRLFSNPELVEEFKKSIKEHTKLMGYQEKADTDFYDDQIDEYGDRVTTDNWKETYSIGGYGSLSKELRQYLGTIVDVSTDEFGNTKFINGEPLIEAANANVLYNGILKAVAGSVSQEQTLDRLRIFAEHNPEAKKFWDKFTRDVDMQFDEEGNFVDIKNTAQATLFQAVVKGFSQFSVDSYFINKDISKGEVVVMEANRKGAAKNQFSIWYNAYLRRFGDEYDNIPKTTEEVSKFMNRKTSSLEDLATILKKGNNYTEDQLNTTLERIILDIRNELGISLSPLFLKFSYLSKSEKVSDQDYRILKAFEGIEPMTEEDAREITTIIKSGKNPFGTNIDPDKLSAADDQIASITSYETPQEAGEDDEEQTTSKDVNDDVDSAIGRLTKIAGANAIFDEQVATTSYKNASGELVYAHQLPTFNLIRGGEIQRSEFRQELKKDKFLSTNFLLNNPLFEYIADTFKVASIDGAKDSTLNVDDNDKFVENKQLNVNQNSGVTYGKMSDREFLVSLFDLYTNNKKHSKPRENGPGTEEFMTSSVLLGVLEASNTGNVVNLPIIRSVEYNNNKISLTSEMSNALIAEVKREYDRITRVAQEISDGFPNGIIEGYHNREERGLKFIKMGNMIGINLTEKLIEAAKGNEDISQYKDEILQQIENYWLGTGGKLDQMVENLISQNIIARITDTDADGKVKTDEKTGEVKTRLVNNLLSNSIFYGFKKAGKYDIDRNRMLNMIGQNPVYNIAQIMMNNYLNTLSARQLFIGDAAEIFKNDGGIDEVKRNRGLNGSGASIESIITSKELGIEHTNKKSHVVTFDDPMYKGKFAGQNKEKADAQMYMTEKTLRYTLFGLGKLNQAQADLLDKIKRGENVNSDDIFGELFKNVDRKVVQKGGSIEYNAQTNSIKLVYSDGKKYIKVSGVMLSKELTSVKVNDEWEARPGSEELHMLREKLEKFENENQTITFGIPRSASKGVKKNVSRSISDINDNNFVEHDNRFWRLQLENPSNKVIITDPTQAKQLIIAEQSRDLVVNYQGKEMSLGEVIDNYLKDTEQRVQNNYYSARKEMFDIEEAFGELRKSLKQNQITPKLGKFLSDSVDTLASTGADAQLVEFFTPIYNPQTGEYTQKYNLNHPITLDKFTQLFLAHYSKGVMSEKVPGHSLALMSNYGMKVAKKVLELDENGQPKRWTVIRRDQYEANDQLFNSVKNGKRWNNELDREFEGLSVGDIYIDDLRHNVPEYDENGKITGYFTEYMTAPHFREHMNIGSDQEIPESALKAFAVRIPSDDKHSFVTTKLVDFLPANFGSTAVFPHELIEISGADFDIDKVYMQIMDSYRRDGELIPYGSAKTNVEKFKEYLTYMSSRDRNVKNKIKELSNLGVKAEDPDTIIGNLEPNISYESIDALADDLKKNRGALVLKNALKELNLPTTVEEYIKYVKTKGELNNGVLNNRILEAKIKMLNNDKMVLSQKGELPVAFQVAEVKPLKDAIENFIARFPILHDILIEAGEDVDSMIGQYKAFKNNKEGSRNIGPAVNAMLVFALMNAYGNQSKIRTKNAKGEDLYVLNIDGHDFNSYEHSRAYSNRKIVNPDGSVTDSSDYDGERIFYHIGAIVNAMTDNAKERLAARLGLNINAVGVVSNMVALGVPLETALMFNLQPAVREFYKSIAVTSNGIKTPSERQIIKSRVGKELLAKLEESLPAGVELPQITTNLLENNIKSNGSNPEANLAIFKSFFEFYGQTEFYSDVAQVLKLSKGLGTNNENIDKIDAKEERLGLNLSDTDFGNSNIPFDLRQVLGGLDRSKPFHNITANYRAIKEQIKELQKSVFLEKTYMFKRLTDTVLANLNVNSKEKETFAKTLKRDIIAYLGIKAYMQYLKVNGKTIKLEGLDNALIYDASAVQRGEGFLDIIDTVKQIREKMPDNYFANKFLNIVPVVLKDVNENKEYINPNTKGGINLAESNTWAKLDSYEQGKLEDSFVEIYSKDRKLALNLFNYLIVKDGGQFKSASFIKFIPPAMFKELLDATGNAHDLLKEDSKISNDEAYKEVFGVTAKEIFNEFTTLYSTNINNSFNIKYINTGKLKDKTVEEKRPKGYNPEVIKTNKSEDQAVPTRVVIDMFGGIRKAEMTLLEDEMGNQFYAETIATGKFTPEELEKLDYNRSLLKARGINTVNRPTEDGKNRYYLELPYTIKLDTGTIASPQTTYFRLKQIGKGKEAVKDSGLGNMIREVGENMILSSIGQYEQFDPTGSRKQWKAGGVTGEMPANVVLRKRTANNFNILDKIESIEDQIAKLESQLAGVDSFQMSPPVQELNREWGIQTNIVGNKVSYFKREKGKDVPYDAKGAKSPQELLNRLNKEYEESGGTTNNAALTTIESIAEPAIPGVPDVSGDFQQQDVTPGDANKFADIIAARKKLKQEVEEQKKKDDKGCTE